MFGIQAIFSIEEGFEVLEEIEDAPSIALGFTAKSRQALVQPRTSNHWTGRRRRTNGISICSPEILLRVV